MKEEKKKNKFLIITMGPGETVQGVGFSYYLLSKNEEVVLATRLKTNYSFLKKTGFNFFLTENSTKLRSLLKKKRPDVVVLCNSKIVSYYRDFSKILPVPRPLTVSLDSNWLFLKNEGWYDFPDWLDKYLIVFPKKIFNLGLKKYGGQYNIPDSIMKKIETVGFIPAYKKIPLKNRVNLRKRYKIGKEEKLIFSYFGGFGAGFRLWAFKKMVKATENLIRKGLKIKIFYTGPLRNLGSNILKKSWLIKKRVLPENQFFSLLASSNLVFQHQGLGTLAQAISSQIPAIANVRDLKDEPYPKHAHSWEISPFVKLNLCKMFYQSTPLKEIQKQIEKLLYDSKEIKKMKAAQKKYCLPGESRAYKIITKLLKDKEKI